MDVFFKIKNSNNKELISFLNQHNLTKNDILRNSEILEKYLDNYIECIDGTDFLSCPQLIKGYNWKLTYENKTIYLELQDCWHQQNLKAFNKIYNNFLICHFPKSMLSLSIKKDFLLLPNDLIRIKIKKYFEEFVQGKHQLGLYIYGAPGIGKTFISILLANDLVRNNYKVCFVFVPELMSNLKQAISKNPQSLATDIAKLQKCDVLFLDDLAGEPVSDWTRDEILFSILNHRMQNNLATFFTSNYGMKDLQQYYSINFKSKSQDVLKAMRLVERIRYLAKPVLLSSAVQRKYAK